MVYPILRHTGPVAPRGSHPKQEPVYRKKYA